MSISSVAACRRSRDTRMVSGTKQFPVEEHFLAPFCNELPLHTIGPYFIVICGDIMNPHGHKKILMRAVDEK